MKKVVFNIGLNNNPFSGSVIAKFSQLFEGITIVDYSMKVGIYDGMVEPTAVIHCYTVLHEATLGRITEELCNMMTQECIAMMIDDVGYLIYRPDFAGERFMFDKNYFLV